MERILQNLLCFITTHWSALAAYYSTWVNSGRYLSYLKPSTCLPEASGPWPLDALTPLPLLPASFPPPPRLFSYRHWRRESSSLCFWLASWESSWLTTDARSPFPSCKPRCKIPKFWDHGLAFGLLKSGLAKFSAYFHVAVMRINTQVTSAEESRWFESINKWGRFGFGTARMRVRKDIWFQGLFLLLIVSVQVLHLLVEVT